MATRETGPRARAEAQWTMSTPTAANSPKEAGGSINVVSYGFWE
jgi:hypothetical protein